MVGWRCGSVLVSWLATSSSGLGAFAFVEVHEFHLSEERGAKPNEHFEAMCAE